METQIKRTPKYILIRDALKEEIFDGRLEFISESRIIQRFGVSASTAMKVLNCLKDEGLLVRKVGKGSIVNHPSRKKAKEIGILFFDMYDARDAFISEVVAGFERRARGKNYHLHFYTTRAKSLTGNDSAFSYLVLNRKIDGLLVLSPIPAADISFFKEKKLPFVVVNNKYTSIEINMVAFDHEQIIYEVCAALKRRGHTKMGLIAGPMGKKEIQRTSDRTIRGYKQFFKDNLLPYNENYIQSRDYAEADGYEMMERFFSLPEQERPGAVIVSNISAGPGIRRYLERNPWKPEAVFYSSNSAEHPNSVQFPYDSLGKAAFDILEKQINSYHSEDFENLNLEARMFFG